MNVLTQLAAGDEEEDGLTCFQALIELEMEEADAAAVSKMQSVWRIAKGDDATMEIATCIERALFLFDYQGVTLDPLWCSGCFEGGVEGDRDHPLWRAWVCHHAQRLLQEITRCGDSSNLEPMRLT